MWPELDRAEQRDLRHRARAATLDALEHHGGEAHHAAIRAWALAHGGFSARELAAPIPAARNSHYKLFLDEALVRARSQLKREGLLASPEPGVWSLSRAVPSPRAAVAPAARARDEQRRASTPPPHAPRASIPPPSAPDPFPTSPPPGPSRRGRNLLGRLLAR